MSDDIVPGLSTKLVQSKQGAAVHLELAVTVDGATNTLYLDEHAMHVLSEACLNGINAATRDRLAREKKRQQYARRNGA